MEIVDEQGRSVRMVGILWDITETKNAELIMRARLRLVEFAATHSLDELLQATLDEAEALTDSKIGFYHFVEEDQVTLSLQNWSKRTLLEYCRAEGKGKHYSVDQAGVWVDCIRQNRPVIHNNYSTLPHRKGLPEGHAEVIRELVVPVMRQDKIVAIFGVGNKPQDYVEKDVRIVSQLSDLVWDIVESKRIEEAQKKAEQNYKDLVETVEGIVWEADAQTFEFSFVSQQAERLLGYPIECWTEEPNFWAIHIHPDDRERSVNFCVEQTRQKLGHEFEYRMIARDERVVWLRDVVTVIVENGVPDKLRGIMIDVTVKKQTDEKLRQLSLVVEQSPASVVITDFHGNIQYVNPKFTQASGYTFEEVVGKNPRILKSGNTPRQTYEQLWKNISAGIVWHGEIQNKRKTGELYWEDQLISPILDENGKITNFVAVREDITELKKAADALMHSENNLKKAQHFAHVGSWTWNIKTDHLDWSDEMYYIFDVDKSTFSGNLADVIAQAIHPEDRAKVEQSSLSAAEKGKPIPLEYRIIWKDGSIHTVWGEAGEMVLDETGLPALLSGTVQDITERKQAEQALQESEEKYRELVENLPDAIAIHTNGTIVFMNNASVPLMRAGTKDDLLGKSVFDFVHPDYKEFIKERMAESIATGKPLSLEEEKFIRLDGTEIDVEVQATPITFQKKPAVQLIIRDITERKRAKLEIIEKSRELEALFNISSHLRTAQSAEEMIPLVLSQMSNTLHADANALILLDEDEEYFTYKLGDGLLAVNTGLRFDVENSISGQILQTLQPYVTLDFANDPVRSREIKNKDNVGPAVLVPLQSESEFLGTLLCARAKDSLAGPFTSAEIDLLVAIGEMVGNALRRAKLYDQALSRLQRVQALRSIDAAINANMDLTVTLKILINQTLTLMDVDAAAVLLYNPLTHILEYAAANGFRYKDIENAHLKLGHGFANLAITEHRLIKIPDLRNAQDAIYQEIANKEGFVSCYVSPMITKGQVCGVLEVYSRSPLTPNQEWLEFLESLGAQAAIAIDNAQLFINLEKSNLELSLAYEATIEGWSHALDLKDKETEGHTLRVTAWTIELAKLAGLSDAEIMHIRRGALLHDIGKMGIPDNILNKADVLTPQEWDIMRLHTQYAYNMIYPIEFLRPAIDIPYCHHEKWDGTGYPRGLKNLQIPYAARLFAIIDVWDALTSDRAYRKAWPNKKAIAHIKSQSGKHFDPDVVDLFMKLMDKLEKNPQQK